MQPDLFNTSPPPPAKPLEALSISDDPSAGYSQRTIKNARSADLTIAVAIDFSTAGEVLTRKAAGAHYLAIHFMDLRDEFYEEHAQRIAANLRAIGGNRLNVAGNGIYTFARKDIEQLEVSQRMYKLLARVHELHPLASIRSGGQTGADIAGLIAAVALKIPAIGLFPKGYVQRNKNRQDIRQSSERLVKAIHQRASELLAESPGQE